MELVTWPGAWSLVHDSAFQASTAGSPLEAAWPITEEKTMSAKKRIMIENTSELAGQGKASRVYRSRWPIHFDGMAD